MRTEKSSPLLGLSMLPNVFYCQSVFAFSEAFSAFPVQGEPGPHGPPGAPGEDGERVSLSLDSAVL